MVIKFKEGGGIYEPQPSEDIIMARYCIDCREYPGKSKCTLALSADTKEELLEAAVQHGVKVHGYKDTPEFRKELVKDFKEGTACGI